MAQKGEKWGFQDPTTHLMQLASCRGIQEFVLLLSLPGDSDETNWQACSGTTELENYS